MNINTASVEQLCTIKGIGPKRAEAIVFHRELYGPVTKMAFSMMMMGSVDVESWNQLDFSVPPKAQIKKERAEKSLPFPTLTSLEAEKAEIESQISETEDKLRRLLSQSKIKPTKTDIHASPHLFRPTVQKEIPIKHSAQTEQESKLVSPPKPTLHLRQPHSPLPASRQSPLKTKMDMVTLQVLQEQTSKQI